MVDRQVDGEEIVEYKGTKIELCCSACVKKFKKDPDYYVKLTKGLLPQIPEKLVSEDLELMDQKFCLVTTIGWSHPKATNTNTREKSIFSGAIRLSGGSHRNQIFTYPDTISKKGCSKEA